jgi:Zn-dependent protease with chaperone function/Flp pilus assembly protein TadD
MAFCLLSLAAVEGQPPVPGNSPSPAEVADLLKREPLSLNTWPVWRARLIGWLDDPGDGSTSAFLAAWVFVTELAMPDGRLPPTLEKDAFAWYLLGSALLNSEGENRQRAEQALRRSLELDAKNAHAHARLGFALLRPGPGDAGAPNPHLEEAARELAEARRLAPQASFLLPYEGELALAQRRYGEATELFERALRQHPQEVNLAQALGVAIVSDRAYSGKRATRLQQLTEQFPEDGELACLHAMALAEDDSFLAAGRELRRARRLGIDPDQALPGGIARQIEERALPWMILAGFGWTMLGFTAVYAVLILLMAAGGLVLAGLTRGDRALGLLGAEPDALVAEGQVVRSGGESALARLYALALVGGLILFYIAIPFVVVGLLATTVLALYGVFLLPRIPVKLIVLVVVIGLGMVWAVLRSLSSRPGRGSFGLRKTAADCPRLYETVHEVARRVDTQPVDEVYLAPGSSISVHQEGRGPFGILGVKSRVLTLGVSTLNYLTVSELRSILAHEYAHFSHSDTSFNRFIYQVTLSITEALNGMAQSGGRLNYVNPFFWFLYLYYRSYTLLSAGFSRSREFLADRMAASLYGSDVFVSALTQVSTNGTLFETTMYNAVTQLLYKNQAFENVYESFRKYRDEQMTPDELKELQRKVTEEKGSVFATHPTFRQRVEAVAPLPQAGTADATPALQLLENPEQTERELTEYLTHYLDAVRRYQAQVAAQ